jgi:hypothetical protein
MKASNEALVAGIGDVVCVCGCLYAPQADAQVVVSVGTQAHRHRRHLVVVRYRHGRRYRGYR